MKARQKDFAKVLASYADCYVMDAFGTAHRKHASTAVIDEFFDKDHDGTLNRLDFISCLASLGLAQVDFSGQDAEAERLFQKVSEGTGKVNKEQYVRFMQEMTEDTFDPEQIAEALQSIADGKEWITETDMQRAGIDAELIDYIKSTLPMHANGQGYDYSSWCK